LPSRPPNSSLRLSQAASAVRLGRGSMNDIGRCAPRADKRNLADDAPRDEQENREALRRRQNRGWHLGWPDWRRRRRFGTRARNPMSAPESEQRPRQLADHAPPRFRQTSACLQGVRGLTLQAWWNTSRRRQLSPCCYRGHSVCNGSRAPGRSLRHCESRVPIE
jgi:hypothetical protein